ncbi:PPK2 family polyphosphate kinase [Actinopolymorpha sp. B11F2]|uniref:PPK2 family polyphosphate kinase n=1 Tax=Actinopolymorpha sp. B11F2 TaxID=3160862 RepID=UPI0032E41273
MAKRLSDRLRLPPARPVVIGDLSTRTTPGFRGGKRQARAAVGDLGPALADLQERLFAEGQTGGKRSLLLVLQGMDTAGKGGTVRHAVGLVNPQGVRVVGFKAPTPEERRRGFLWRIRRELPAPGYLGIFDRSHYEDVLVARVRGLVGRATWSRRYATITRFEDQLTLRGTRIVKCFLHISKKEQKKRLMARLDNPTKHWKYDPNDVAARLHWDDYQQAYQDVLERTDTEAAPWYVIPSDHKWYRNWAVTQLLVEHLQDLDPQWPAADFDVEAEKARLSAT